MCVCEIHDLLFNYQEMHLLNVEEIAPPPQPPLPPDSQKSFPASWEDVHLQQ